MCEEATIRSAAKKIADSIESLASAVTVKAAPGTDATGGRVESLTEAVMGITNGLLEISHSIKELADAVRSHNTSSQEGRG